MAEIETTATAGGTAREAKGLSVRDAFQKAVALQRADRNDEAAALYRKVISRTPGYAPAWSNYGVIMRNQGRLDAGLVAHRRAFALDQGTAIRKNLANTLQDLGEFEEAEIHRKVLLDNRPRDAESLRDYCATLRALGRHDEVVRLACTAEAEGWADDEVVLQRGFSNLTLGQYPAGFADFEKRFAGDEVALPKNFPAPRWLGEPIAGKSLHVLPEQGFGDAIMCARFLPRLRESTGARVMLRTKGPLARLFAGLEGVDGHVLSADHPDRPDVYTPNMSLPHLVGVDIANLPPPARLTIPADSRQRARTRMGPFEGLLKVGIVWTGSLTYKGNARRSVTVDRFARLAGMAGVQLVSLYKGPAHADFVESGFEGPIFDACGDDRDFADTAAIIDELDLMITTDTAVVHVGASLGKPVWNMLAYEGFWLYGTDETTPWYPSMRLFRQPRPGDWDSVFATVEAELAKLLAERGSTGEGRR